MRRPDRKLASPNSNGNGSSRLRPSSNPDPRPPTPREKFAHAGRLPQIAKFRNKFAGFPVAQ
jgi:hypothetical protein